MLTSTPDALEGKIVKEVVPVPKARATGLITEASPGRLLGLTVERSDYGQPGTGILYGVEVNTGEVLFSKRLPWSVSIDDYWPHWVDPGDEYLDLVHGPDEFIWTYLKDVLVRIDPKDASVHVVGRIEPPGRPIFAAAHYTYDEGAKIPFDTFNFIAGVFDGKMTKLFVNGEFTLETAQPFKPKANIESLCIGTYAGGGGSNSPNGIIDEVAIYNRALTLEELKTLMDEGLKGIHAVSQNGKLATLWGRVKDSF